VAGVLKKTARASVTGRFSCRRACAAGYFNGTGLHTLSGELAKAPQLPHLTVGEAERLATSSLHPSALRAHICILWAVMSHAI